VPGLSASAKFVTPLPLSEMSVSVIVTWDGTVTPGPISRNAAAMLLPLAPVITLSEISSVLPTLDTPARLPEISVSRMTASLSNTWTGMTVLWIRHRSMVTPSLGPPAIVVSCRTPNSAPEMSQSTSTPL